MGPDRERDTCSNVQRLVRRGCLPLAVGSSSQGQGGNSSDQRGCQRSGHERSVLRPRCLGQRSDSIATSSHAAVRGRSCRCADVLHAPAQPDKTVGSWDSFSPQETPCVHLLFHVPPDLISPVSRCVARFSRVRSQWQVRERVEHSETSVPDADDDHHVVSVQIDPLDGPRWSEEAADPGPQLRTNDAAHPGPHLRKYVVRCPIHARLPGCSSAHAAVRSPLTPMSAVLVKAARGSLLGIRRLVRSGERINLERADLLRTAAANRELRGPLQGFLA